MADGRTVKFPNGVEYTNVPDSYTDAEAYEIYKSQRIQAAVDAAELESPEKEKKETGC